MRDRGPKYDQDSLDHYMRSIQKFAVLSREDEDAMMQRYLATRDKALREQLINANLRFVVRTAHEYKGYGMRMLDVIQEGNVGLIMAIDKFDPAKGCRLISFAVWWIRAYIQNYIMRYWSSVRVGTTQEQKTLFYKLKSAQREVYKEHPELEPSEVAQAVAKKLGIDIDVVNEMDVRMSVKRETSLSAPISEESATTTESPVSFEDRLVDPKPLPDEQVIEREAASRLSRCIGHALDMMPTRERDVVEMRLMDDATLVKLGNSWGVSRERARQVEVRTIKKIKYALTQMNILEEDAA